MSGRTFSPLFNRKFPDGAGWLQLPLLEEQDRLSPLPTGSLTAPRLLSLHRGMQGNGPASASQLAAVLALSPLVFSGDLIKAGSGEGAARSAWFPGISPSCLRRIDPPNTAGAVIAWGPIELPKAALLLEPEFLLWLLILWIFPCRIAIALCHPRCSRVGMPCGLPAPGFGSSSSAPSPSRLFLLLSHPTPPRLWKRFLKSLLLIHTHGSYFSE